MSIFYRFTCKVCGQIVEYFSKDDVEITKIICPHCKNQSTEIITIIKNPDKIKGEII